MSNQHYRERLLTLNNNLNILRERQAKYGLDAPVSLLNQIKDHEQAIALVEQAIQGEISESELVEALAPLNLGLGGSVQNIFQTIQAIPKPLAIGTLLIGVIIIILLFLISPQGQLLFGPGPTITPQVIRPAKSDENLVIVAEFVSPPDNPIRAGKRIHRELGREIDKEGLDVLLELFPPIENINHAEDAGRVYSPTFIIWGETDATSIMSNFTIPDSGLFNPVIEDKPLADLDAFQIFISHELPAQMTFFTEFTLGQIYFREQNYPEAERMFKIALDNQPPDIPPDALANVYFFQGFTAHNLNNVQDAIDGYSRAIELDSSLYPAYFNRGVAHQTLNLWDQALADYDAAIKLEPNSINVYINRGELYRNQGRLHDALADFDRALALNPDVAATLNNRSVVHFYLGNLEQALADANRAVELSAGGTALNTSALINRALVYQALGSNKEALADFRTAAETLTSDDPLHLSVQSGLAWSHYLLADYETAVAINRVVLNDERYQDIAADRPEFYQLLPMQYNLALALLADGKTALAETAYDTALNMGNDPYALETAITDLQDFLGQYPNTPGGTEILEKLQAQ